VSKNPLTKNRIKIGDSINKPKKDRKISSIRIIDLRLYISNEFVINLYLGLDRYRPLTLKV